MEDGRGVGIERLPGKKRKSINLYETNEYSALITPLAYCLDDEAADVIEKWLGILVKGVQKP